MQNLVVVGLQWGDEGKGKIVDFLSEHFDIVARFQGGANAGHTVVVGGKVFKLRLLPAGTIRGRKVVIGNGVVVDPHVLLDEISALESAGIDVDLMISDRAHIITPFHIQMDGLQEMSRGSEKVGTTQRGIGPAYSHKHSRVGVRVCDLLGAEAKQKWDRLESLARRETDAYHVVTSERKPESAFDDYRGMAERLSGLVGDTGEFLSSAIARGKHVLFEGAQGTLLDIDHGTYPYVTSSNCVAAAASTGSGVSLSLLDSVLGVVKAYSTRVGTGPFPTELNDETGALLRQRGSEFGTVTGRPRRCGWLDLVALKYAVRLNGPKSLAMTKVDVLSGLNPVRVCIAYDLDGREVGTVPARSEDFERVVPVYEDLEGWDARGRSWSEICKAGVEGLPSELLDYLHRVEDAVSSKVSMISLGSDRSETIVLEEDSVRPLDVPELNDHY